MEEQVEQHQAGNNQPDALVGGLHDDVLIVAEHVEQHEGHAEYKLPSAHGVVEVYLVVAYLAFQFVA